MEPEANALTSGPKLDTLPLVVILGLFSRFFA